ncbi:MAG TPA: SDR family oxidoreductase [Gammaproteobacteria bacterium]|nr:SDR family oxidoreductase [Gammaproteobacteria bacterium]
MTEPNAIYPSLEGRVVFITGGGTGIGAAMTRAFCAQRARVAFVDIAETESRALVDDIGGDHAPLFIPCDLRDIPALQASIERVRRELGPVGALVNNAANDDRHDLESVTLDYWNERIAINQRPMFFAIQSVLSHMRQLGGGSIINFGSMSWKAGTPRVPVYASAKASAHGLTRSVARDFGKENIRANTIVPGWVMTERQRSLWLTAEGERTIDANQFLAGRVQPDDLAAMALFLAADDSRMCSAQEFTVDGGWV